MNEIYNTWQILTDLKWIMQTLSQGYTCRWEEYFWNPLCGRKGVTALIVIVSLEQKADMHSQYMYTYVHIHGVHCSNK
jgi:hypothetical protein